MGQHVDARVASTSAASTYLTVMFGDILTIDAPYQLLSVHWASTFSPIEY